MIRYASRAAVLVAVGLVCGQPRLTPAGELPVAPPPRPKLPTFVVRSVTPADDSAVASKGFVVSYGLTQRDAEATAALPGVAGVVPVRHIPSDVRNRDRLVNGRVVATVAGCADIRALKLSAGRFLTAADDQDKESVCVLGAEAATKLFPFADPLGQSVTLRGHDFKVVGLLSERGAEADLDVYVPLRTSRARFGEVIFIREAGKRSAEKVELSEVVVRVSDANKVNAVADAVRAALEKSHPRKDWEIVVPR